MSYCMSSASIWFEIWGSWIRVKKIDFAISEKFRSFHAISQKIRFSRQISEEFRFFSVNFTKIFDFFRQFHKTIAHLQLLLSKLFYFSSKSHYFRTLFPVHDML